jgi:hypothetical protein
MSDSLPPLPWSYVTNAPAGLHEGKGFVYLIDANGRKIGTVWGNPDEKLATVALIMDLAETAGLWVCAGCGTSKTLEQIKGEYPDALSCCPERKMVPRK